MGVISQIESNLASHQSYVVAKVIQSQSLHSFPSLSTHILSAGFPSLTPIPTIHKSGLPCFKIWLLEELIPKRLWWLNMWTPGAFGVSCVIRTRHDKRSGLGHWCVTRHGKYQGHDARSVQVRCARVVTRPWVLVSCFWYDCAWLTVDLALGRKVAEWPTGSRIGCAKVMIPKMRLVRVEVMLHILT